MENFRVGGRSRKITREMRCNMFNGLEFVSGTTIELECARELKVTREKQGKMRQSIENKRETRSDEMSVTVMFHDSNTILPSADSFSAHSVRVLSLSEGLTGGFSLRSCPASFSAPLTERVKSPEKRRRRSILSLSPFEKFSAEAPMAHSAAPVFGADQNASGNEVALTTTNQNTEQRCCFAA